MKKKKWLEDVAQQIQLVRTKLQLTQEQLTFRFNRTAPLELTTTRGDIAKYEAAINDLPASKFIKFLRLGE